MQIQNERFQKFRDDKLVKNLQNNILKINQTKKKTDLIFLKF